jgi:hypothetical protein
VSAKFIHIAFNFEGRDSPDDALKKEFNRALDWVSYAPNCWILYTTTSIDQWYKRVKKIVPSDASILIVEVDLNNKQGFLPPYVWEWLNKNRDGSAS